jgi:NhaP-type Na+/H+ or K+/H+ antiporter
MKDKKDIEAEKSLMQTSFTKENYIIMAVGLLLIIIGYVLMIGGGNADPNVFNEVIFNTQRIVVSPILLAVGYAMQIWAIFYKKRKPSNLD